MYFAPSTKKKGKMFLGRGELFCVSKIQSHNSSTASQSDLPSEVLLMSLFQAKIL